MAGFWQDLLITGIPVGEKIVRTVVVYGCLVVGVRIFGKRELGRLNPLDLIVLLLLANTVQNAIIGPDTSLLGGLIGALSLFLVNRAVVRIAYLNPKFRRLVEGTPELLIRDGRLIKRALEENSISREELVTAAREHGVDDLANVETAQLEVSGDFTFVAHDAMTTERFHAEVLKRLTAIERKLAAAAVLILLAAAR